MTAPRPDAPLPIELRVRLADLPDQGTDVAYTADEAACRALAEFAGLVAVRAFHVEGAVCPLGDIVDANLRLTADVVQTCVVSLEPVADSFTAEIRQQYAPRRLVQPDQAVEEVLVSPDEADPPEPYDGEEADLGPLLIEHFVLGLDPYPRKEGAVFDPAAAGVKAEVISPFDVLKKLKKDG